jgi:cytoskeletal protein CcmA (bactofilin family)
MGMFKRDEVVEEPSTSYVSSSADNDRSRSVIGKTLFINGEITSDEEVLIEGKIEGTIRSNHRVIVGTSGNVNADIDAKEVIIKGAVKGNVSCSHKIEIVPDGRLTGNITSDKVVLAEGAIFKGHIDMQSGGEEAAEETEEIVEAEVVEESEEAVEEETEEETEKAEEKKPKKKKK